MCRTSQSLLGRLAITCTPNRCKILTPTPLQRAQKAIVLRIIVFGVQVIGVDLYCALKLNVLSVSGFLWLHNMRYVLTNLGCLLVGGLGFYGLYDIGAYSSFWRHPEDSEKPLPSQAQKTGRGQKRSSTLTHVRPEGSVWFMFADYLHFGPQVLEGHAGSSPDHPRMHKDDRR